MIYAIEAVGSGAVKIGYASDLAARLAALGTGNPFPLVARAQCAGRFREERLFHRLFAKQRPRGEWFEISVLTEFVRIASHCAPNDALEAAWEDALVAMKQRQLTEPAARRLLSYGLKASCADFGPKRVAKISGCDEKTIRRARDEESTLGLACTWNLLDVDPHALDALAAAKGVMLVPLIGAAPDIIASAGAAIHRIGAARAEASPGGAMETDAELIASEIENDALLAACLDRRARIAEAKLRRAAA